MNINNNVPSQLKRDFNQIEGQNESPPSKYPKLSSVNEKFAISTDNSPTSLQKQVSKIDGQPEIEKVALDLLGVGSGSEKEVKDPVNEAQLPYWNSIPIELRTMLLSNLDFIDLLKIRPVSQELKAIVDKEIINYVNRKKIFLDDARSNVHIFLKLKMIKDQGKHLKYLGLRNETNLKYFGGIVSYCPNLEEIYMHFSSQDFQVKAAAGIKLLTERNKLSQLKTLSVQAGAGYPNAIGILMDAPLRQLTSLEIATKNYDDLLERICQSTHLSNLKHLSLRCSKLKPESLKKLHSAPFQLSSLDLRCSSIDAQHLKILKDLTNSSKLSLSKIDLSGCKLGDENMSHLADLMKSSNITSLDLEFNNLTEKGIEIIAPHMSQLFSLSVSCNKIGIRGLELILNAKPKLTELYMMGTNIGDQGAQLIFNSTNFKFMHTLDLQDNDLSTELFLGLEGKQFESNLEFLYIGTNSIKNSAADKIAQSKLFSKLKLLGINNTEIGPEGAITILKALHQLKEMWIDDAWTDDETYGKELGKLATSRGCSFEFS